LNPRLGVLLVSGRQSRAQAPAKAAIRAALDACSNSEIARRDSATSTQTDGGLVSNTEFSQRE
jgi:hypothetical protein